MYLEVMEEQRQLQARFQWGLLLVTDDVSSDRAPSWSKSDAQFTNSVTAIVVKVLHAVDGAVIVRVAQGQPASEEVDPSGLTRLTNA